MDERNAELLKGGDHLLGLVQPHQPVVDEDAGQPLPHRPVDEQRGDRGIDPAGEAADHPSLADLGLDLGHLLGDHRLGRPLFLAAGDVAQETGEDLRPVGRVDDFGVELDAVETAIGELAGRHRRPWAGGERGEALRRLEDRVAVAHPAALLLRKVTQQPPAAVAQDQVGSAELTRLGRFDLAAQRLDHCLHAVTDAQYRDLQVEQLSRERRRPRLIHRRRPPGEHKALRLPLADLLRRGCRREQFSEHPTLADAPRNQLGILPTEIEDKNLFQRSSGGWHCRGDPP